MKNNYSNGRTNMMDHARFGFITSFQKTMFSTGNLMGKSMLLLMILLGSFTTSALAQLTGVKSIPGDYADIATAVSDLNAVGVGAGGVTFNVAAGHTESSGAQITITTAGAAGNPIVFQKSGAGANPSITRTDAGSSTTSTIGGLGDAVIRIDGTDYLTFDGIDVSASLQGIEYGYLTSKPSVSNGCQFVTIQNCVVTMTKGTSAYVIGIYVGNGATSVSSATGLVVNANSGRNENISITGNTIQNVHAGIYCRGYSTAAFYDQNITVSGNTIQNFGGGSSTTTYGVYFIYTNNPTASNNIIDNAGGGGTPHAATFYSIFYSTVSGVVDGSNNVFTLNTSSTSAAYGIYNSNAVTSNNFSNNSFSGSVGSTTTSYLIYASSTTPSVTISGNQILGSFVKTGASGTFYCYYNLGSPTSGLETITNNNFSNLTTTGTGITSGIYTNTAVGQNRICHSNTISNWNIGSTSTSYMMYVLSSFSNQIYNNTISNISNSAAGGMIGLYFTGTNPEVYNNSISNVSAGTTTTMYGIQAAGTGIVNLYNNKVYGLSNNNSASTAANLLTGIHVSTNGTTTNIYNNLVGDLNMPNSISTDAIRGINLASTTANTSLNISFNTIYLNASSAGVNFGCTGIYHTTSAVPTSGNLTLRNNIIYNSSTYSGTGVVAAYRRSNSTTSNYNAASNNNIFYGGATSPNQVLFADGTTFSETIGDYQSYMAGVGADQSSYTEDVIFISTSGASADFLKVTLATPSAAESGAQNIAGITDDYSGTIRQGNPGYLGTGTAPDIGAYEFEGALPSCGMPAASNAQTSNSNPCNGENFTLSMDVAYGLGHSFQWEESTTGPGGPFTPISGATNETFVTSSSVSIWYRCVITCISSSSSNTSAEVGVTIPTALNGTYLIDNTGAGDYISFAAASDDLACKGVSGPVVFNVTAGQVFNPVSDLVFTFTGDAVNTITFQRTGAGANPKIARSGTSAITDFIIHLNGVDYYTFDGIDFEQTGTSATDYTEFAVYLSNASSTNGAQNNTIKNGNITLSSNTISSKGIYVFQAVTATNAAGANSNNRFLNMNILSSWEGYRFVGAATTLDNGNEIGTEFGGNSSVQNLGDGVTTASVYGIFATYQSNCLIQNTDFHDLISGGTSLAYGISFQASAANSATIKNNRVYNINSGGVVYGIHCGVGDTVDISNNEIYALATTGTAASIRGIFIAGSVMNANVNANRIYNIAGNGITTTISGGIEVSTGLSYDITNNMISDIRASASTQTGAGVRGITVTSGTSANMVRIYQNTVLLSDISTVAGHTSAALHNSSTTPILDVRNNIFINNCDISIGLRAAAFWKTAATDNVSNDCNNNIYYSGAPDASHLIYYDGTNSAQTLVAYNSLAAISPAENLSYAENTAFDPIVGGVIRPDAGIPTYAESGAQVIASVPSDFEGDVRSLSTPDVGADEGSFTIQLPPLPDCVTYNGPADLASDICSYSALQLSWSAAITGGPATLGYDVYFGTSPSPSLVANVSTPFYVLPTLNPNTTYYWQVIPKNVSGDATGCSIQSFTTVDAQVNSTTPDSRCGTGTVALAATGSGTLNWYDSPSGGLALASGPSFVTPSISSTTDYYVSAGSYGAPYVTGRIAASNPGTATTLNTYGMHFTLTAGIVLNSVDVFSSTGTAVVINLYNAAGTTILQTTGSVATTTASVNTIPLNFTIGAGTYRLHIVTTGSFYRENSGPVYPISLGGVGDINGFFSSITGTVTTSASYYFMYNWNVTASCESPRQMVTATVIPSTTYYTDADGDTYGDPASPVISCTGAPVGTVADNTDCNDASNSVYPGAAEACNGIDDDCNGTTDDGCAVLTFYADVDGDSYGNAASSITQTSTTPPVGYVSDNTDCNDGNIAVNPAATEVCNLIDDDCDASIDEGFDVDNDGFTSCNGDCNDNDNTVYPGATEVCNGVDDDCNLLVDDNVPALPNVGAISGTATACLPGIAGSTSYSIAPVAGATTYVWSVPAGFTIASGQGSTSIMVSWTGTAMQSGISGALCVYAADACVSTSPSCVTIDYQVAAPVTPPSISGPGKVCTGDVVVYSIALVNRATSYTWTVPATMTITAGQGTNVITASVDAGYIGGSVSVVANNVCGTSPARSKSLVQNFPATPSAIQGQKEGLCNTAGNAFSIPTVSNATSYNWGITGGTIASGQGTNAISVDVAALIGSGSITVQAVNGCGTSLTRTLTIIGAPARPEPIAGSTSVCDNTTEAYGVATVAGAASYTWVVTPNGSVSSGQGTKNITVDWTAPATGQSMSVSASNACGTGLSRSLTSITVNNCPRFGVNADQVNLNAFPNPAADRVTIQFTSEDNSDYRLRISDVTGRTLFLENGTAAAGLNTKVLSLDGFASGVYNLTIEMNNAQQQIKLIVE